MRSKTSWQPSKTVHKRKVGLFGGTFDPIHFGHINLALELKERANLDEIWVCPAFVSPFRTHSPPLLAEHRSELVKQAVSDIPDFFVLEEELERGDSSYTIDTVHHILSNYAPLSLSVLLGADSLCGFDKWKQVEEIILLAPPLIGSRRGDGCLDVIEKLNLTKDAKQALSQGIVDTPYMDISATVIRDRLKNKLYCGHLLPRKELDYIYQNQLYC